jgi:hypothetical protein
MRNGLRVGGMAVALGTLLAVSAGAGEAAAPELPLAGWVGNALSLEDLKGQVVALVFYDDNLS